MGSAEGCCWVGNSGESAPAMRKSELSASDRSDASGACMEDSRGCGSTLRRLDGLDEGEIPSCGNSEAFAVCFLSCVSSSETSDSSEESFAMLASLGSRPGRRFVRSFRLSFLRRKYRFLAFVFPYQKH